MVSAYTSKCEPITAPFCKNVWYNTTVITAQAPNHINQTTQKEAVEEVQRWKPLNDMGCSPDLVLFLCSVHLPVCTILDKPIPPCRSLCQISKSSCEYLMNFFGYDWPDRIECDLYPINGPCVSELGYIIGDLVDPGYNIINITRNETDFEMPEGSEGMPEFMKMLLLKLAVIAVCSLVGLILGIVACVILVKRYRRRRSQQDSQKKHKYETVNTGVVYAPQPTAVHDTLDQVELQKTQTNRSV